MTANIAVIAGSLREGSFNRRLAALGAEAARAAGASVTEVDLEQFPLPIYRHEIEAKELPAEALALKRLFQAQDGFLFASPEYNGSIPPVLKNAIDWASRPSDGEGLVALSAYRGKVAAVMSASISPFGGLRALGHLRHILTTIQLLVLPEQVMVPFANRAFDGDQLAEELPRQLLTAMVERLVKVSERLSD